MTPLVVESKERRAIVQRFGNVGSARLLVVPMGAKVVGLLRRAGGVIMKGIFGLSRDRSFF